MNIEVNNRDGNKKREFVKANKYPENGQLHDWLS